MTAAPQTIDNRALRALLKRFGACREALDWLDDRDGERAWNECERADWLLWLLRRIGVDRRLIVRATVACVQPAVTAYVPADEPRPQRALDAALRWADDPTEKNRGRACAAADAATANVAACDAAYAYACANAAAAYAYAAVAYANAAAAANAAAYAANAAANAAYAAAADAYAVDDAVGAADAKREARAASLRRSAQIIRDMIPYAVVLAAVTGSEVQP